MLDDLTSWLWSKGRGTPSIEAQVFAKEAKGRKEWPILKQTNEKKRVSPKGAGNFAESVVENYKT